MARSYVREARRRGLGSRRERIGTDRRASRRGARRCRDRPPVRERRRAPHLRDALGADDRRERQPRHGEAVRQVPDARGLPRRAAGGARAGHLPDGLLPAEGEGDPRLDAGAAGGVRRAGPAHDPGVVAAAGRGAEDGERRRGRARRRAGDRRRHARAAALAAARADAGGGPGQDRARPRQDRAAGRTGTASRISSSGTAGASATRDGRGARTACSPTSARRAGCRAEHGFSSVVFRRSAVHDLAGSPCLWTTEGRRECAHCGCVAGRCGS